MSERVCTKALRCRHDRTGYEACCEDCPEAGVTDWIEETYWWIRDQAPSAERALAALRLAAQYDQHKGLDRIDKLVVKPYPCPKCGGDMDLVTLDHVVCEDCGHDLGGGDDQQEGLGKT